MTKLDTKKYVAHIIIGAILSFIIFPIVREFATDTWTYENCILVALLIGWVLAAPLAFFTMWLDHKMTIARGKKWDGGLGFPGSYGPSVLGYTFIIIVSLVRGWLLHL